MKKIKVGLVQQAGHAEKQVALDESYKGIKEAVAKGAELVL